MTVMSEIAIVVGLVTLGYFLGSIPFGYLVARAKGITDIRETGSGGTGATNVSRKLGKKYGVAVLILDAMKCFLPVLLTKEIFGIDWIISLVILSTVLGHIYPVWLKFRAGKGVASALGGISIIIPGDFFGIGAGLWLVTFLSSRYVSLANLVLLLSLPVIFFLTYHSIAYYMLGIVLFCIIAWAHRENIIGIRDGKERKTDLPEFPILSPKSKSPKDKPSEHKP